MFAPTAPPAQTPSSPVGVHKTSWTAVSGHADSSTSSGGTYVALSLGNGITPAKPKTDRDKAKRTRRQASEKMESSKKNETGLGTLSMPSLQLGGSTVQIGSLSNHDVVKLHAQEVSRQSAGDRQAIALKTQETAASVLETLVTAFDKQREAQVSKEQLVLQGAKTNKTKAALLFTGVPGGGVLIRHLAMTYLPNSPISGFLANYANFLVCAAVIWFGVFVYSYVSSHLVWREVALRKHDDLPNLDRTFQAVMSSLSVNSTPPSSSP